MAIERHAFQAARRVARRVCGKSEQIGDRITTDKARGTV
jgi:hypothetical protein